VICTILFILSLSWICMFYHSRRVKICALTMKTMTVRTTNKKKGKPCGYRYDDDDSNPHTINNKFLTTLRPKISIVLHMSFSLTNNNILCLTLVNLSLSAMCNIVRKMSFYSKHYDISAIQITRWPSNTELSK